MQKRWTASVVAGLTFAFIACGQGEPEEGAVATVNDYTLTVDQVVELLVDEEGLVAETGVVRSLANYWIDYTLLAEAVARDSTFSRLDLEPLVQEQVWQTMVFQLRDSVIQVDTFISESELEALYETEAPEVEVRARHIMLTFPVQATQAQRDSVRQRLADVRARILDGASFEALAQQVSHDRGSATAGGDLGYFGRGDMVAPFERAALALEPGEVSEIVETPMGLHLIRVDDRRIRDFDQASADFRARVQAERVQAAESTFVSALEARVGPTVTEGAVEIVKEIARNPSAGLSGRAARRNVVEWDGGAVTVGEVQTLVRLEGPQFRNQLVSAPDEQVTAFLEDVARRELLVDEARRAGLEPSTERMDTLLADAAAQLRDAARMLGLMDVDQAPGEAREIAVARAVEEALAENLSGATRFVPLGLVAFQLRDRASFAIHDTGIGQAILRIGQVRATRSLAPTPSAPADTTGDGQEPPTP